jgi:phenylpropionate dioxygenase-like ring-hydroxylating dioxygenase large terminal subunit
MQQSIPVVYLLHVRLAPLSEGRVESGTLMCSYHGWRFDSQGKCVDVPQVGQVLAAA